MTLHDALASFLDLLLLAEEPRFTWGPAELRAAFQWGVTLQGLVDNANAAPQVHQRLQALQPQLPSSLRLLLPVIAQQPMQVMLEQLLRRKPLTSSTAPAAHCWLESVLGAYMAAVVLPSPPGQQAAAEQRLTASLARLQLEAAAHDMLAGAARQAAAAACSSMQLAVNFSRERAGSLHSLAAAEDGKDQQQQQRRLRQQALRYLTSPACLQVAAAAQLLAQRAQQELEAQSGLEAQTLLAGMLQHSPSSQLVLELLCWMVLLPAWEATLRRLAELEPSNDCYSGSRATIASFRSAQNSDSDNSSGVGLARHAAQLLCAACVSGKGQTVLQVPAELLAEVCRQSFAFTCSYSALLAQQRRQAAGDTQAAEENAGRRYAHATKHADHVSSYMQAKIGALVE